MSYTQMNFNHEHASKIQKKNGFSGQRERERRSKKNKLKNWSSIL